MFNRSQNLLNRYSTYLEFRSLTVETRRRYLDLATTFLESTNGSMSRDALISFLAGYTNDSSTYRRWMCNVLRSLYNATEIPWPLTRSELPKLAKPKQPFLAYPEFQNLQRVARSLSSMEYALVRVCGLTAARRKQICEMMVEDYQKPMLAVRGIKGGEDRIRTLDNNTCVALDNYLKTRRVQSEYLFCGPSGKKLSVTSMSVLFRKIADAAGLPKGTSIHAIRRGVTTWLYKSGMREKELQEAMGWKSTGMASRYIQLVESEVEERVTESHPMFKDIGDIEDSDQGE